ncbi:hypothetical protein Syun_021574 [Stephania yunnanensis]|uniref:Uncharacterized protein n=1 Tax=Stephania yunnanensis TaxID=152371 RepID=A0AAP0IG89_9MAGN
MSTTAQCSVPGSSSGATDGNEEENEDDPSAPLPGGPIDRSMLKSFKNHIAAAIWNKHCSLLKWINHRALLLEWDLQSCHPDTEGLQMIIQRFG